MSTVTATPTILKLLSDLVRLPTVASDRAALDSALDFVTSQLDGLPLGIKRFDNQGSPGMIATAPGARSAKNPRLWLAAHLDVIPASPAEFEPKLAGRRLIGRGAYDMKYAAACFIRLLRELGPDLDQYDLGLMLTTDEEQGGQNGVRWLVDAQGYRGGCVLLPECGTSWTIEAGAKGTTCWRLRARGLASHASRPWDGHNAIDQLTAFVAELKTHVPAEPCGDDTHTHCTINLGQISGGAVANQVPNQAEGLLDIRLAPGTSLADLRQWLADAGRAVPDVTAELVFGNDATVNPMAGPASIFAGLVRDVTGRELSPTLSHGASDGRFFNAYDIPVISVPPTGGGQHSAHEWVDLDSLEQYYEVIRRFADRWAGPGRLELS